MPSMRVVFIAKKKDRIYFSRLATMTKYIGVTEAVNLNRVVKENQAKYSTIHVIINISAPI